MLSTGKYTRRSFEVEAIRVTNRNFDEVAEWCGGAIVVGDDKEDTYIKASVAYGRTERQTRAYVGDWVLKMGQKSFKIYTDKSFRKCFERLPSINIENVV